MSPGLMIFCSVWFAVKAPNFVLGMRAVREHHPEEQVKFVAKLTW